MNRPIVFECARVKILKTRWKLPIVSGVTWFFCMVVCSSPATAHQDLTDQIQAVTEQITLNPNDVELYLKRGELSRRHRDWNAALHDYEIAARLAPGFSGVDLALGRMWFDAGRPKSAERALDAFLVKNPEHANALALHGRVLGQLGQGCAAARDFSHAIELLATPVPDFYLDRARALASCGKEHLDQAIKGLESGMKKMGFLVPLQTLAIDLELSRQHYDAALIRLEQIERRSIRKEKWLLRKGEILIQAGRSDESLEAFRLALAAIQALPERHRTTKGTMDLETRLHALLNKTDKE